MRACRTPSMRTTVRATARKPRTTAGSACWRGSRRTGWRNTITVHHLNNSRSQRVLWLLEELGLEYEVKRYERNKQTLLAPPELKAVHPLGKSPVVQDGDQVLAESGAIVEHLADRYGSGKLARTPGSPERYRYTYWLHYAEGSAMPPLLMRLIFDRLVASPMPFFVRPIVKRIR